MVAYPKLFEPINIGKVSIKNRIAMAPMGIVGLTNPDGSPGQRAIDYYVERARGGLGLIITGLFSVRNEWGSDVSNIHRVNRSMIASFGELSEAVHALGTKIFVQLTAGFGRVIPLPAFHGTPVSASAIPYYYDPGITCRPLETGEVEEIVAAFGTAAEMLRMAGVDGIELHGHEGYLFDQFTTAIWNKRTDKYGGNLKERLTLPVEVLETIKKHAGDDFPVQYRFGLKHYIKGLNSGALRGENYEEAGRDIAEGLEMAKLLEEAGFDALHVDAGCYDSWYWAHPPVYQEHGCMVDMASRAKEVVKIPVIAVGRLEIPEMAEEVIASGKADMVALGRGLLADPYWSVKASEGRDEDIRPCIGCHDGCIWRFMRGRPLSCAVNPACGREKLYQISRVEESQRVLIIGGGVAGMEAARVAAARGYKVVLYEKGKSLGGHLIEASVPDFKKDLGTLVNWYENQIRKLGVELNLETEASEAAVAKESPDVVIIATGSQPIIPDISGIDNANVITCMELLLGKEKAGKAVVVIGGGLVGCETALWLAKEGREVTIVEVLPQLMTGDMSIPAMNRQMLIDLMALNKVDVLTGACIEEIIPEGVTITVGDLQKKIKADTVVIASGLSPDNELYRSLSGQFPRIYAIGDCQETRNIMGAIWDGFEVGRTI